MSLTSQNPWYFDEKIIFFKKNVTHSAKQIILGPDNYFFLSQMAKIVIGSMNPEDIKRGGDIIGSIHCTKAIYLAF